MNQSGSYARRLALVLLFAGVLLAFVLTALMVWPDLEAFSYGFPRVGNAPMRGLSCPVFMNRNENAALSLTLDNTTERVLRPQVRTLISDSSIERWSTVILPVAIEPGERITVTWEVGPGNIVLRSFVLVKVFTFISYPMPNLEGTCGIFVVDLPWIDPGLLHWAWLAVSLVFVLAGVWVNDFWNVEGEPPSRHKMIRLALAVLCTVGLIAGSLGWWPVGAVVLILILLTLLAAFMFGPER